MSQRHTKNKKKMENITNEYRQLLISGILGDGHVNQNGGINFTCIHKDYLEFKKSLVPIASSEIRYKRNAGYKKDGMIYTLHIHKTKLSDHYRVAPLTEVVQNIDELGLAMWFYDDGSLHNKKYFYNINTHSFSLEDQENILIPLLNKYGIFPRIMVERKKDGRVFNYLYVGKYKGADKISNILSKYPVPSYTYKIWNKDYYNVFIEVNKNSELTPISKAKIINKKLEELKDNQK